MIIMECFTHMQKSVWLFLRGLCERHITISGNVHGTATNIHAHDVM